jgi:hypothetical protein
MKWFVFGHEIHNPRLGNDLLGCVETVVEDQTDAERFAQIKFGAANVAFVTRACHMERNSQGKLISVDD